MQTINAAAAEFLAKKCIAVTGVSAHARGHKITRESYRRVVGLLRDMDLASDPTWQEARGIR